jgi:predicted 3-demethylubiquinone-9 3-methyltransferase (glyoxalase superfamily)
VECGWVANKYGLFWQVVPAKFVAGLERVMQMTKLDLATLQRAFAGK